MKDGTRLTERVLDPKGEGENPMSDADLERKFVSNCEPIVGKDKAARLLDALWGFDRLDSLDIWLESWDGSRRAQAHLKNLTSQLIGRFAHAAVHATKETSGRTALLRFGADVVVPAGIRAEIAVLKGIVATFVMSRNTRQPIYAQQRQILTGLADILLARGPEELDPGFQEDWHQAASDGERKRVVVDQVASLTDQSALSWYERLVQH